MTDSHSNATSVTNVSLEELGIQLASFIPGLGQPFAAILQVIQARESERRTQQLIQWIAEVVARLEAVELSIDKDWAESEEGIRTFLGLGEAACDLLREEKITLLAGAEVSALMAVGSKEGERKRFCRILIEEDLDTLKTIASMAHSGIKGRIVGGGHTEASRKAYLELFGDKGRPTQVEVHDALQALHRHRLATVYFMPSNTVTTFSKTIRPTSGGIESDVEFREEWARFAGFVVEAIKERRRKCP